MPNVIPFRKRRRNQEATADQPRHRREGHFDEQDNWHDAETPDVIADATSR